MAGHFLTPTFDSLPSDCKISILKNPHFTPFSAIFHSITAPITADAATTKTVGVGKSFTTAKLSKSTTYKAKITGLSTSEKKIVSVSRKVVKSGSKKGTYYVVKGKKAGKASFKIGSKSYTVKVGATSIKKKTFTTSLTAGTNKSVSVTATNGAKDTLTWKSNKTSVVKVSKASTEASASKVAKNTLKPLKAGSATITVASKYTGKKLAVKVTVKAKATPTATPSTVPATDVPTTTPETGATSTPTATGSATATPTVTGGATATPTVPGDATATPAVTGSATATPVPTATATGTATPAPTATAAPTQTPEVVSASVVSATAVNTQDEVTPLTAVTKNGKLKITFNKAIKESTVNNSTFTVTDANGKNISLPASDVSLEIGGKTVSVDLKNIGLEKNNTYKLTVKGVVDAEGFAAVDYTTDFTVAGTAIIQSVRLSYEDAADELSTNMYTGVQGVAATDDEISDTNITKYVKTANGSYRVATDAEILAGTGLYVNKNSTWDGKVIQVKYDALLDATTVNAANIELTNTTTGERVPVTYQTSANDGTITITAKSTLITKNLYKLTIKGVKTAVNGNAEELTHVFTVNGVKPFDGGATYRTIDGKAVVNNTYVWPMLTAGNKETALNDTSYFAGLQITVAATETLDASTVEKCVYLVEKETKEIVDTTVSYNAESKMITIVPKANLKEDTDYQIQYLGGLRTTDYVYLDSNKKNDVVTSQTVDFRTMDATAPEVVSIEAKNGTNGLEVAKAQEFIVTFSESVTLNANGNQILLTETSKDVESENIPSERVEVAVVAGTDSKQWTVKIPADSLEANKAYKLRVLGKDAKDWASVSNNDSKIVNDGYGYSATVIEEGVATPITVSVPNRLKKTATYTFSTENDTTAPSLVAVYEGDDITDASKIITGTKTNVSADDKFTFVFDEKVQFTKSNVKIEVLSNGTWTEAGTKAITATKNKDGDVVGFTVTPGCTADAKYRIVIDKGVVVDYADKEHVDKCNEFDLYRYELIGTAGDDVSTAVSMIANTGVNADGAAQSNDSIKVNSRFFVGLQEEDTTGISENNLTLLDSEGNKVAGEIKEVTNTTAKANAGDLLGGTNKNTIYVFIPSKDLAFESTYTLVLENVKDAIGNTIEKKAITFKTAADATKVSSIEGVTDGEVSVNRTGVFKINFNNKNTELAKNTEGAIAAGEVEIREKTSDTLFTGYELKADTDKKVYTISFTGVDDAHKLAANTTYVLKVKLADIDEKANETSVTFTTGLDAKDIVKPSTDSIKVGTGNTFNSMEKDTLKGAVTGSDTIKLTYSEAVKADDIAVSIVDVTESTKTASVTAKTLNSDKTVLSLAVAGLKDDTTYKVTISGVKDEAGNEADAVSFFVKVAVDVSSELSALDTALNNFNGSQTVSYYNAVYDAIEALLLVNGSVKDATKDMTLYNNYAGTLKTTANDAIAALKAKLPEGITAETVTAETDLSGEVATALSSATTAVNNYVGTAGIKGTKTSDLTDYALYVAVKDQDTANKAAAALTRDLATDTFGDNANTCTLKTSDLDDVTDQNSVAGVAATVTYSIPAGTESVSLSSSNVLTGVAEDSTGVTLTATITVGSKTATHAYKVTVGASSTYNLTIAEAD